MIIDTPILIEAFREKLGIVEEIGDRLTRVETFVAYLDEMWKPLSTQTIGFNWEDSSSDVLEEIAAIRWRQVNRRPGRPRASQLRAATPGRD
jgi:hypothetical protein